MHIPSAMSAVRPVCVLLGGAGQHRTPIACMASTAKVAVLLLSPPPSSASAPVRAGHGSSAA